HPTRLQLRRGFSHPPERVDAAFEHCIRVDLELHRSSREPRRAVTLTPFHYRIAPDSRRLAQAAHQLPQAHSADLRRLLQGSHLANCLPQHGIAKLLKCRRHPDQHFFELRIGVQQGANARPRFDRYAHFASSYCSNRRSPSSKRIFVTSCVTSSVPRYRFSSSRTAK